MTFLSHFDGAVEACGRSYDLVFVLDISGSMQASITSLVKFLHNVETVLILSGFTNILIICYSDYDLGKPTEQVHRVVKVISGTVNECVNQMSHVKAGMIGSGGSAEEAVATALNVLLDIVKTNINVIWVTDAPHHPVQASINIKTSYPDWDYFSEADRNAILNLYQPDAGDAGLERHFLMTCNKESDVRQLFKTCTERSVRIGVIGSSNTLWHQTFFQDHFMFRVNNLSSENHFLGAMMNTLRVFLGQPPHPGEISIFGNTMITYQSNKPVYQSLIPKSLRLCGTKYSEQELILFQRLYDFVMNILTLNPPLCRFFPAFFSAVFFSIISILKKEEDWSDFRKKNKSPEVKSALDDFVASKSNNLNQVFELVEKYGQHFLPPVLTEYLVQVLMDNVKTIPVCPEHMVQEEWLVYTGPIIPSDAFIKAFGYFLFKDDFGMFLEIFQAKNFALMPVQQVLANKFVGFNPQVLSDPVNIHFLKLLFSAMTGFQTLPNVFKVCGFILAMNSAHPILQNLSRIFVNKHLESNMDWLFTGGSLGDDKTGKIQPWWCSFTTLNILEKILKTLGHDTQLSKIACLKNIATFERLKSYLFNFSYKQIDKSNPRMLFCVKKCQTGWWMPESLILPNGACIYCQGVHGDLTDEGDHNEKRGMTYHADGTNELDKAKIKVLPDGTGVCTESDHYRKCSKCSAYYVILDLRLKSQPLCYNHRRGAQLGDTTPIAQCIQCSKSYVYGHSVPEGWICATCQYNQWSWVCTEGVEKIKLETLCAKNDLILNSVANQLELEPEFFKSWIVQYGGSIEDPNIVQYIQSWTPYKPETPYVVTNNSFDSLFVGSENIVREFTNLNEIVAQLNNIRQLETHDFCMIGACLNPLHHKNALYSVCGQCNNLICIECLKMMMTPAKGTISSVHKFYCPGCGAPPSVRVEALKLSFLIHSSRVDSNVTRLGWCMDCERVIPLGPVQVDVNGVHMCRPDNPDDDIKDFRCELCLKKWEEAQIVQVQKIAKTELELKTLLSAFGVGVPVRECECGALLSRADNWCAHMVCSQCHKHLCWICGELFGSSGVCYDHMRQAPNHAGAWQVTQTTPIWGGKIHYGTGDEINEPMVYTDDDTDVDTDDEF